MADPACSGDQKQAPAWGLRYEFSETGPRLLELRGPRTPLLEPELVVLEIELDPVEWPLKLVRDARLVAMSPVREAASDRKKALEEVAQVRWKDDCEPPLDPAELNIGEAGFYPDRPSALPPDSLEPAKHRI